VKCRIAFVLLAFVTSIAHAEWEQIECSDPSDNTVFVSFPESSLEFNSTKFDKACKSSRDQVACKFSVSRKNIHFSAERKKKLYTPGDVLTGILEKSKIPCLVLDRKLDSTATLECITLGIATNPKPYCDWVKTNLPNIESQPIRIGTIKFCQSVIPKCK
jgi:hypothetical protein